MVPDFLSVFPLEWPFSEHALVSDDAHCEVINRNAVVLSAHDFRGHVTRSATCVLRVLGVQNSGNSKVSNAQVTLLVKHQVFGFNVAMKDMVAVQVFQTNNHAGNEEFCKSGQLKNLLVCSSLNLRIFPMW